MKNTESDKDKKKSQIPLLISSIIIVFMLQFAKGMGLIGGAIGGLVIFSASTIFYEYTITCCNKKNMHQFISKILAICISLFSSLIVMLCYLAILSLLLYGKL